MARRHGGDRRGSAYDRRVRKAWLLSSESGWGGDGELVPCVHCGDLLDFVTLEADKIVPGEFGPGYVRTNIQPSCRACNLARSDRECAWDCLCHDVRDQRSKALAS